MKLAPIPSDPPAIASGFVEASGLLDAVFPNPASRPSKKWVLAMGRKQLLPCVKIGGKVLFEPSKVIEALRSTGGQRAA